MNTPLPHDTIVPFANEKRSKKEQVAEMFDQIAFRYDFLNRFLSGGIDIQWRKKMVKALRELAPKRVLDVATGTADVALMTYKYLKPEEIVGIDISAGMLEIGRQKIKNKKLDAYIKLQQADSEALPFPDNHFDAITVAFGVRNFEHLATGLAEMHRVLRPGGKLVVLEFSKPKTAGFKSIYKFYLQMVTPGIGKLISKNKTAYQYLNDSVQAFPEGEAFEAILKTTGFVSTAVRPLTLGVSTLYLGTKALL